MKTINLLKISLLLFVIAEFLLSSCSVIGLGIGAAVDGSKPKRVSIGANEVNKIDNKSNVTIHKKDGTQLYGKYAGISQVSQQDYAIEYKKFKEQNKEYQFLPEPGDSIKINYTETHFEVNGLFMGFGNNKIWFSNLEGNNKFTADLDTSYATVQLKGNDMDYQNIKRLMNNYIIPVNTTINLRCDDRSIQYIPLYEVAGIIITNKRNAKFIGLGAGLAIDAIIAVMAVKSAQSESYNFIMSF